MHYHQPYQRHEGFSTLEGISMLRAFFFTLVVSIALVGIQAARGQSGIQLGVFNVDVSPPIGSPVAYVPAKKIVDPLSARGVVIRSGERPIVLCAVDFIGIGNEGQDVWKKALADAANTTPDRVSVHALHQHDGPRCDFSAERHLAAHGLGGTRFDNDYLYDAIARTAKAVGVAAGNGQPVTHVGFGEAKVEKVASNRRILGEDGKVKKMRFSATRDPKMIAEPEGTIDPWLKSLSFWNGESALAVISFYATHPQSHYRKGGVTCEFVGIARNDRETKTGVPHIYFTGAAGNVAAGKYNDGLPETRPILAARVEAGMKAAWDATERVPVTAEDVEWRTRYTALPIGEHLVEETLRERLADEDLSSGDRLNAATKLAWLERTEAGIGITVSALRIGKNWILNMPGELFVEYQLAAQEMRPEDHVCMAAYEDYGAGYIGTEIGYSQGGYETSDRTARVAPGVEKVLMDAMKEVLADAKPGE